MSIASELTKLETDITNAYDAVQIKGGTIPSNKNTENLSTAINSISGGGGGKPEQSKTATPSTSSQIILPDEGYTLSSVTVEATPEKIRYDIMNKYITNTLEKLRINNVPSGNLKLLKPGDNAGGSKLTFVKYLEFPNNTDALGVWQFGNLTGLLRFDAGYTTKFDNVCLSGCTNLKALIIRTNDVVPSLYNRNAISMGSGDYIYVPKNMIENYKVATNWTNFADNFKELYIAETIAEKEQMLIDSEIGSGSMIVCDIDESYTIKE